MPSLRFAPLFGLVPLVLVLGMPSSAVAATAPTLTAPAASGTSATEGASMAFEWSGELQGDPDALDRSFFRLEVIKAASVPSGAQSAWPDASLENSAQTAPGAPVTKVSLGVPTAGEYRWRVCAWGVVDDLVANEITQLPGGCSTSRAFSTVAATVGSQGIGELKMEEKTQVEGETRTVYVEREAPAAPTNNTAAPASVAPSRQVVQEVEEIVETTFTKIAPTMVGAGGEGSAIGGVGGGSSEGGGDEADPFASEQTAERKGVAGAVVTGLGSSLPFVPIPFWTLALLLTCFPVAILWRRSVLGMFDWTDGSIDGRGGLDDVIADLAIFPVDQEVKNGSMTADGTAAAPAPVAPSAPDRGRHAA